jgi:hypothetical protein
MNSAGWDKLRKQYDVERRMLDELLATFRPLLDELGKGKSPSQMELMALASLLHSFYNGVENVFKRIALMVDGRCPRGDSWHTDLLVQVGQATPKRPGVLSQEMLLRLKGYMDFRHMFRHAYAYILEWGRMDHLVLGCAECLEEFERGMADFLRDLPEE